VNLDRYKRLIMESVPSVPGQRITYDSLRSDVKMYCSDLGHNVADNTFKHALESLHVEQCIVYFNSLDIRPTQYGLNKYSYFS